MQICNRSVLYDPGKRSKMLAEKKISADTPSDLAKKGLQVDIVVHPEFSAYPEAGYPDAVVALM